MTEIMLAKISCLIVVGKIIFFRIPKIMAFRALRSLNIYFIILDSNLSFYINIYFPISVFVICHIVRWIPNIYEIQQGAIISAVIYLILIIYLLFKL